MKTLKISLFFLLFACSNEKPLVETSAKSIFLGKIAVDSIKHFKYTIYNKGNAGLKVISYNCSCDCTLTDFKPNQIINPKDSLTIEMIVRPKMQNIGKFVEVNCTFKTNADSIFNKLAIQYIVM
jgi:Protein of unknown function (DUF1573)